MTKINMGGVDCRLTHKAGEIYIKVNLSRIGRHVTGPWKIAVLDDAQLYSVTVVCEGRKMSDDLYAPLKFGEAGEVT